MVGKTRREIFDEKVSEPLIRDNAGKAMIVRPGF